MPKLKIEITPQRQDTLRSLFSDFSASIVVFLIALPLCLGIALGSNAPLISGLIAGVVGGIIIGALSNSPLSVSGPAAGLIAIVAIGIQKLGSFESFLLAGLIAGIIQIVFGFLRFGSLADFVPNTVIKGMLAAIGIILIVKQIPHFVGYDKTREADEAFFDFSSHEGKFFDLLDVVNHITPMALAIGLISIAIMLLWNTKYFKKIKFLQLIPSPLVAVISGVLINDFFESSHSIFALSKENLVNLPSINNLNDFTSAIVFPNFGAILNPQIFFTAVTIALVASMETLLCIEATDKIDPYKRRTSTNRELKAQGTGNAISALLGGLPITSVIVRSSTNANAGAQSKASTMMHGLWLFLAVIFIPHILQRIPYASLSAIMIITGYKLTNPSIFKGLYRMGQDQMVPFLITIAAILLTNLLLGVAIGIIFSFFFILDSNFRSSLMMVHNEKGHYLLRLRKDVSFLNKAKLKNTLEKLPKLSYVLIDVSRSDFIDKDVIEVINDFAKHAHLKKITVEIKRNNFKALHRLIKGNILKK